MEITLEVVRSVFVDVLEGRMTREAADRWAYAITRESESGTLTFAPHEEMARIWAGVMYLYGIDTMEEPGEYLHTEEDIRTAMQEKVGGR
ncbi:hypothetical protein ACQE3E_07080 [Methylomonas sp. MED-D]|uniref:hypothetical protein n=1 Tax=unclassified Methylomonas TaxID=2608980 RepID=UPI0008D9A47B|nr:MULTISPECIES: hypothetical protein [unclassified Methylomonas]MDT4329325.1 hypothetical protein [Methylomonas sp. MV1]OHX38162.1 hypothetical protein BJL95_23430 [Methylomonas sp. LWB]